MKKKIIFVVTLLLIAGLTCFLIFKLRSDDNSKIQNDEFYAVVRESYAGYALVKPLDEDINYDVLSISVKDLKVGDIIRLKVKDIKEIYPPEAEVEEIEVLQTDKISELDPDIKEEVTTKNTATAYIALLVNNLVAFFISSSFEAITAFDKSNIPYKISNIGTPI